MDFNQAISIVASALQTVGTTIDGSAYDGVIVKKLEASNTLDDGRTTNQTHIAITGNQMDIFPYVRADGYFNDTSSDAELKKYFIPQIPVCIHEDNCLYLNDGSAGELTFVNGFIEGKTSVVRSKRKSQADQIQVSLINFDSAEFVAFRKMLHAGSFFLLLKRKKEFKYDVFGIVPGKGIDADGGLSALNNQFFKLPTNTVISVYDDMGTSEHETATADNELAFKNWLSLLTKSNGEHYSENTQYQYVNALKAVGSTFGGAIGPFTSVFQIDDADVFDRAVAAVKADEGYEEFNRSRGNGSLSAGLDLYARFLREKNDTTSRMFTPEWFQEKAAEYPTLDDEANALLADFQAKYNPEYLASLSGVEMLNTIFLNAANAENVCRVLEFGPQIKDTFGSIKGGTAYKYGLYYSTQGAWMTGSGQKPRQLTEEEAIEVGAKLRDHLVAGANAIKEYGPLSTLEDYKKLHKILHDVTEGDIERVWFLKYYQMLYPELFATNYSDYAQRTVLDTIGEEKEKYALVRMGQIRFYANKCGISNVMFNKIFWEYYSEEAVAAKAEPSQDICYNTGYSSEFPRNRILFGAPGTGKSFTLNQEKETLLADGGEYERVTFHPDYSYANFVGTYKPVPCKDDQGHDAITYAYVPGPFMRTYVKALQNSRTDAPKPFLLVIEEINRANVAAVFGDVFQLLDRGDDEVSEYPIQASEDIKKYRAGELGGNPDDYSEIRIPDNMFIWATMNSADQGVFPMDTAFKRRWDFTYLGIDDSEAGIVGKKVVLGQGEYRRVVEWNALRKAINSELLTYKVNEDKLMGPYFISKKNLPEGDTIDPVVFTRIFKNKVLMYLFDDAAKQKRPSLFAGCKDENKNLYSQICREFDTKGVFIFCTKISDGFLPEDDGE